ncbi:MAG: poly-gamma-glutamate hydrolase family protein [Rhodomicrobium sp.]
MARDKYDSFLALSKSKAISIDYIVRIAKQDSSVGVIAPHGGNIEIGTSQIAFAIAAQDFNFYSFEGLKPGSFRELHITSVNFDEPSCLKVVSVCDFVIAIHGMTGNDERVGMGGLDLILKQLIQVQLRSNGFEALEIERFAGVHPENICNRGRRRKGVQLEVSKALRKRLLQEEALLADFSNSIRLAIQKVVTL